MLDSLYNIHISMNPASTSLIFESWAVQVKFKLQQTLSKLKFTVIERLTGY